MEVGTGTEGGENEPIDVERFICGPARMESGTGTEGGEHDRIDVDAMQACIAIYSKIEDTSSAVAGKTNDGKEKCQIQDEGQACPQDGQPSPPQWSEVRCDVSNTLHLRHLLEKGMKTDLGARVNELYMRITGATPANYHLNARWKELGFTWQKTWTDTGGRNGNGDATRVMPSSFEEEPMRCSNIADVPEIVKKWLHCLWEQHIPRTWRRNTVASISIVELRKGQLLNTSVFVMVTHGYLAWKERRVGKNGAPFLMCRLTETQGLQGVLFFIFQKEFIDMIEEAPLQSMIGLCGLESVPKKGYSNRA